jgi:ABC-2 type transport system ATP-binding protein
MNEADQLCDRVAFINNGRIVAVDTPNRLKARVKEKEIVEITVYSPPPDIERQIRLLLPDAEVVKFIRGNEDEGSPSRIKIIGGTAEEHIETVIDTLRQNNVRIGSLNVGFPTLEDVFIKLTGAKLTEDGT